MMAESKNAANSQRTQRKNVEIATADFYINAKKLA
jgi:hypothetical protein